ncbi:DUF5362 domain-containing protein [Blastopirellula marina]|uniref:Uncharacterized protein n=1 Tax=Blastopirellula marina DSM 3645 TaxID=314230 RepID=A3ZMQ6_9BACT|nr:DUF5362 domain-containing protein [Blastopirellula marina]EAQ82232.1 hypothetical protein DSM3645_00920 [Blastopirellula marina DSM 3645]
MPENPFASPLSSDESSSATGVGALGVLGLLQPLREVAVWSKVLAASLILFGAMFILSIIGIVIAWLPIWSGVLLWQHANRIAEAQRLQDTRLMKEAIEKLAKSIKIVAIFQVVIMAVYALYFLVLIVFVILSVLN